MTADHEPDTAHPAVAMLPGVTSTKLRLRGLVIMVITGSVGICLIAVESYLPGSVHIWAPSLAGSTVAGVFTGLAFTLQGQDKASKEIAAGYTTSPETAQSNPALYVFDWRSKQLIRSPQTPPQTN